MNGLEDIASKESKVSHAVALANQLLGIAPHVHTYNLVKRCGFLNTFFFLLLLTVTSTFTTKL